MKRKAITGREVKGGVKLADLRRIDVELQDAYARQTLHGKDIMARTPQGNDTSLSPEDMKLWLAIEEKTIELAAAQRIREATSLVSDYAGGVIDQEEANRRLKAHEDRWGLAAKDEVLGWELRDQASTSIHSARFRQQPDQQSKSR